MSFLTAEWRKLAMVNFIVDRNVLQKYIPFGTELDAWNDQYYVSLVGFLFHNTKLLGFKIPFHSQFEEVNLRFYVKRYEQGTWKRGVVFIKEIVPKPALAWVANTIYKENYETLPMRHSWQEKNGQKLVEYAWKKRNKWNNLQVRYDEKWYKPEETSEASFITDHYWGYARVNDKKSIEYQVTHPTWELYKIHDYQLDVDFSLVYGKEFGFLGEMDPASVLLAEGSYITVEKRKVVTG